MRIPSCVSQPDVSLTPVSIYPTLDSLKDVLDYADSKLPITSRNEITSILFIMQNTLLAQLHKAT
jgi:hypothetical protein